MTDKPTYYAQFDGDEVDGKIIPIGEPIPDTTDVGTLGYLISIGRVATTPPAGLESAPVANAGIPDDSDPATMQARVLTDVDPMDMSRDELIRHYAELSTVTAHDDQLRQAIFSLRERAAQPATPAADDSLNSDEGKGDQSEGGDERANDDDQLKAVLAGTIADIKAHVANVEDREMLARMVALERAGEDRAGAVKEIEARIAALAPAA